MAETSEDPSGPANGPLGNSVGTMNWLRCIIKRRKKTFTYIWWYRICESSTICHMDSHHFCDQCALHVDG